MIKEGEVHEVLHAVAMGLAEETNSEPYAHDEHRVELAIHTETNSRVALCLLTIDDDKGTFTLQLAAGHHWSEPFTVDLMEPDSIEKVLLPMIPMSNTLTKGLGKVDEEKPGNEWAHRSIFTPRNRR